MQLSRREQCMRENLQKRGVCFIPPTFKLPDISACDLIVLSGQIIRGQYDETTIVAYLYNGKIFVPDVNALDEKALNKLLNLL